MVRTNPNIPARLFRNPIINGDMRIDQANAGAAVSVATTAAHHSVDRWIGGGAATAGVFSLQRATATPPVGFSHYLRATVTTDAPSPSATHVYAIRQVIEGYDLPHISFGSAAARLLAISFWVRSSINGAMPGICLVNNAFNRFYVAPYSISTVDTWEHKRVFVPGDTSGTWQLTSGVGLYLYFPLGGGSSRTIAAGSWGSTTGHAGATGATQVIATNGATLDITGVQVEVDHATEFEQLDMAVQLLRCQRFFRKSFALETAPAQNLGSNLGAAFAYSQAAAGFGTRVQFDRMEHTAAPTITTFNPGAANANWRDTTNGADRAVTVSEASPSGFVLTGASGAADSFNYVHWTARREISG